MCRGLGRKHLPYALGLPCPGPNFKWRADGTRSVPATLALVNLAGRGQFGLFGGVFGLDLVATEAF